MDEIKAVLSEYKLSNCDVAIREPGCTADDLVDVIEGNRVYIPCIYVSVLLFPLYRNLSDRAQVLNKA